MITVNETKIIFEVQLNSEPTAEQQVRVANNMREWLSCYEPTCSIEVVVIANGRRLEATKARPRRQLQTGYTLRSTITVREDGTSTASNVESEAQKLSENTALSNLTSTLFSGTTFTGGVTAVSPLVVQKNIMRVVVVDAPSPPPSEDPPVAESPPASPPPADPPKEGSSGLEGWLIAVIVVVVALVALVAGLVVYRLLIKRQSSTGVNLDSEKGGFPLAIGASTTQHV